VHDCDSASLRHNKAKFYFTITAIFFILLIYRLVIECIFEEIMAPQQILKQYFGYDDFRGQQGAVIEHVMSGRHALVIMPTGMGKSLCFQIPALLGDGLTVVISPLIALMKDQVDGLLARGIDATFINSSLNRNAREKRYAAVKAGKYQLLYVTPERFRKQAFVDIISRRKVGLLAVDEAHCISQWGHDYRPDYTRLKEFRMLLGEPTTVALTATATPDVQKDIVHQLGLAPGDMTLYHEGINRPNLHLEVIDVMGETEKLEHIKRISEKHHLNGIVYFCLIKTLSMFSDLLLKAKVPHLCYHGSLDVRERKAIQNEFMEGKNILVLATNAFGMGIDKEDIRFVIHADLPGSMESYYQEIGRGGRDGLDATCALLYDQDDLLTQMEFIKWSNPDVDFYARVYQMLEGNAEMINHQGMDWFKEKLHHRNRHDFRLDTVLAMFDRYGIIEGSLEEGNLKLIGPMPTPLQDIDALAKKLENQQKKLLALVNYTKCQDNKKAFIHDYFGLPMPK